jgi:hypothetical protein
LYIEQPKGVASDTLKKLLGWITKPGENHCLYENFYQKVGERGRDSTAAKSSLVKT